MFYVWPGSFSTFLGLASLVVFLCSVSSVCVRTVVSVCLMIEFSIISTVFGARARQIYSKHIFSSFEAKLSKAVPHSSFSFCREIAR